MQRFIMCRDYSKEIYDILYGSGKTLATAESCTGGAIAAAIVAKSGASDYFKGGIVSYCNEIKEKVLGVSAITLAEQTAVCEDVAKQMASGAMKILNTDYAVSITGCAGPDGGTKEIPVGTIWICVCDKQSTQTLKLTGDNGRKKNLDNAANQALKLLVEFLK